MGLGNRELRIEEHKAQKAIEEMEMAVENFKLLSFQTKKDRIDIGSVPDWALGDEGRRKKYGG